MTLAPHTGPSARHLVTGGCGFLGCNIADALAGRGDWVLALDNMSRAGAADNGNWLTRRHGDRVRIHVGDIRDFDLVQELVAGCAGVLHLAAQVAVTTSVDNPIEDFEVNARGTLNLLEAIRCRNPHVPFLFASTNKVYGKILDNEDVARNEDRYVPVGESFKAGIAEDASLDFYSPYGCSKGVADQYARDYARVFGLRTAVLRMSCIYGPRQCGTEDQGWIAHFLLSAMRGEDITIFGDGFQVRDALYVDDAVAAWLGILDNIERVPGAVFNLGGGPGNSVSLRELLKMIAKLRGRVPQVHFAPWRPGDQPWYVSDTRSLTRRLEWTPRTPLKRGLAELDAWLDRRFGRMDATALQEAHA
jgi:CDP-paratose 2-epimerase